MVKIHWNKVTWYSKLLAVIVFLAIFAWAFYLGRQYEQAYEAITVANAANSVRASSSSVTGAITESLLASAIFACDAGKTIQAEFMQNNVGQGGVALKLSDGRSLLLPQAISADGARYAKPDGSFVFWNKGNGAFVSEGAPYATTGQKNTFTGCVTPTN